MHTNRNSKVWEGHEHEYCPLLSSNLRAMINLFAQVHIPTKNRLSCRGVHPACINIKAVQIFKKILYFFLKYKTMKIHNLILVEL